MTITTKNKQEDMLNNNRCDLSGEMVDDEDSDIVIEPLVPKIKRRRKRLETKKPDNESDSSERESEIVDVESTALLNEGWANSIAKILRTNKPKRKKSTVLSKAKKLTDLKRKTVVTESYEIATRDGEVKKETVVKENEQKPDERPKKKRRDLLPNLRTKPNILDKDRDRTLQKIATKGVVQLFNAVKTQQKDISKKLDEAGPLEVKKDRVLKSIDKRAFLDVLMGEKSTKVDETTKNKTEREKDSTWNVLRDDFMMSAKMKDWDKEEEEEEEVDVEMEMESEIDVVG